MSLLRVQAWAFKRQKKANRDLEIEGITMEETYEQVIMREFRQHLNYCNDCHNHGDAQEVLDCFLQGIEEKLPNELDYDEDQCAWVIPDNHAPDKIGGEDEDSKGLGNGFSGSEESES